MLLQETRVINAAGKLTALGGSAQSNAIAAAQMAAAGAHVDLSQLRALVGDQIADMTGAQAACITTGAAAGIAISVAALICRKNPDWLRILPRIPVAPTVVIQAGHNINFGADIEQMVFMTGAKTEIAGTSEAVTEDDLNALMAQRPLALLYVQSHHCIQENRIDLATCVRLAREYDVPVIVDAAAEEDLEQYVASGADLVTYSGGKAFGGPTSGFILGSRNLIDHCEQQFGGIARPMKVGKEQLLGLAAAMQNYQLRDIAAIEAEWQQRNQTLLDAFSQSSVFEMAVKPDEAGRAFSRIAVSPHRLSNGDHTFSCDTLVNFLKDSSPSIRTRNHQIREARILIDPRELSDSDTQFIIERLQAFTTFIKQEKQL